MASSGCSPSIWTPINKDKLSKKMPEQPLVHSCHCPPASTMHVKFAPKRKCQSMALGGHYDAASCWDIIDVDRIIIACFACFLQMVECCNCQDHVLEQVNRWKLMGNQVDTSAIVHI